MGKQYVFIHDESSISELASGRCRVASASASPDTSWKALRSAKPMPLLA